MSTFSLCMYKWGVSVVCLTKRRCFSWSSLLDSYSVMAAVSEGGVSDVGCGCMEICVVELCVVLQSYVVCRE